MYLFFLFLTVLHSRQELLGEFNFWKDVESDTAILEVLGVLAIDCNTHNDCVTVLTAELHTKSF